MSKKTEQYKKCKWRVIVRKQYSDNPDFNKVDKTDVFMLCFMKPYKYAKKCAECDVEGMEG